MTARQITNSTLYVIATPIGNLEDITFRAVRTLKEVDYIAAEDTRHTRKLLNHYAISTKLIRYYREKEQQQTDYILALLQQGFSVGLVTDAGTPAISDPGAIVVRKCLQSGFTVVPIPGPSAFTTALSCAGIHEGGILFIGFLPGKKQQRQGIFQSLVYSRYHLVFYESPRRILQFFKDAYATFGDRDVFIGRELTKSYEELVLSSLASLANDRKIEEKGEFVIIISPAKQEKVSIEDIDSHILWYRDNTSLSVKECSKALSEELGLPKSDIYRKAVALYKDKPRIHNE